MVKAFSGLLAVLPIVFLCLCKESPSEQAAVQPEEKTEAEAPPAARIPFTPPADSMISAAQMKAWSSCNALLDSLTFRYADSFKTEDPAAMIRYQDDFITAQDKICVRAGLPGGYQEYKWILQNLGIDKNRSVLESVNAQTF